MSPFLGPGGKCGREETAAKPARKGGIFDGFEAKFSVRWDRNWRFTGLQERKSERQIVSKFTPSGKRVLFCIARKPAQVLKHQKAAVTSLAFNDSCSQLAAASRDGVSVAGEVSLTPVAVGGAV